MEQCRIDTKILHWGIITSQEVEAGNKF